jgi:hypothetical protein
VNRTINDLFFLGGGARPRPGTGTTAAIHANDKVTIAAPAFSPVLFALWLGPKPPNPDLKKGLLGP